MVISWTLSLLLAGAAVVGAHDRRSSSDGADPASLADPSERSVRKGAFRFIDPLLDCRQQEGRREIRSFRRKMDALLKKIEGAPEVSMVAVYFRDLSNGAWFGEAEKEAFLPASLLKVPVMMAVFREAEGNPGILTEELRVADDSAYGRTKRFSISPALVIGSTATVADLVSAMIQRSDNRALMTLIERFGSEGIQAIYDELGVPVGPDGVPESLRVKDYAALFRLLYNASYLGRKMSERALLELTQTDFRDGLVAPLPGLIPIAHKYGERGLESGEKQLHDCGIIYHPGRPYILCVMTRGSGWSELAGAIRGISKMVYGEVNSQFPLK